MKPLFNYTLNGDFTYPTEKEITANMTFAMKNIFGNDFAHDPSSPAVVIQKAAEQYIGEALALAKMHHGQNDIYQATGTSLDRLGAVRNIQRHADSDKLYRDRLVSHNDSRSDILNDLESIMKGLVDVTYATVSNGSHTGAISIFMVGGSDLDISNALDSALPLGVELQGNKYIELGHTRYTIARPESIDIDIVVNFDRDDSNASDVAIRENIERILLDHGKDLRAVDIRRAIEPLGVIMNNVKLTRVDNNTLSYTKIEADEFEVMQIKNITLVEG